MGVEAGLLSGSGGTELLNGGAELLGKAELLGCPGLQCRAPMSQGPQAVP